MCIKILDIRFRIYYGERENMDGDEFLEFTASAMNVGKTVIVVIGVGCNHCTHTYFYYIACDSFKQCV